MNYNQEAQEAVLGSVLSGMMDPGETGLLPEHFYGSQHQELWKICLRLNDAGTQPDFISVCDQLPDDHPLSEPQGIDYITNLAEDAQGNTENIVSSYSKIIHDHWARRYINTQVMEVMEDLGTAEVGELLERLDSIGEATQGGSSGLAIDHKKALSEAIKRIDEQHQNGGGITGLSTGLADLDQKTNGLQNTDLVILGARPSMGKTALAINIMRAAMDQVPVAFFSLEMPRHKILARMLTADAKINYGNLQKGQLKSDDWNSMAAKAAVLSELELRIDDRSGLTPSQMRAACKRYRKEMGGLGLIVVDYLQLMSPGKKTENETHAIGYISEQLKRMAKDFNCPVLALCQLNRGLESRTDRRPRNSDLRQSGNIEQDADLIMFIYRDEVYNEKTDRPGTGEIIIGKAREGEIGVVPVAWQGQHQRFDNLAWSPQQ